MKPGEGITANCDVDAEGQPMARPADGPTLRINDLTEDDYRGLGLVAAMGTWQEVKLWLERRASRD